jgi:hypothetical protein
MRIGFPCRALVMVFHFPIPVNSRQKFFLRKAHKKRFLRASPAVDSPGEVKSISIKPGKEK